MHPYKILCSLGRQLEKEWDDALEKFRITKSEEDKNKVYKATKIYFFHRRECMECKVVWRQNEY